MQRVDCAVIGSGIGGLVAALTVAKSGRSVMLIEAGKQFGGYLNPFQRKRYHFDVGLHYIGQCGPQETFTRLLDHLELDVSFNELNPDGFDRYVFPGYEVTMGKGHEAYMARLIADFPSEERGIRRYFRLMQEFDALLKLLNRRKDLASLLRMIPRLPLLRHLSSTFSEIVKPMIRDPLLRSVLAAPCGDIGMPPSRVSGLALMMVANHYLTGAYYPRGGSRAISDAFIDALRQHGAVMKRRARVTSICVENGSATRLEIEGHEPVTCDQVIANLDARVLYQELLDPEVVPLKLRRKADDTTSSLASIGIYMATDLDLARHGFTDANIWHYEDVDIDAIYEPLDQGEIGDKRAFFMTVPTIKDPDGGHAPDGQHTFEVIALAPYEPFAAWSETKTLKRGDEYNRFKARLTEPIMDLIEKTYVPDLREHLAHFEVSTPLTNLSYTLSPMGSIYGPEHSPDLIGPYRYKARTPIPNLYLCGSSVLGCGIVPCAISGRIAARAALG